MSIYGYQGRRCHRQEAENPTRHGQQLCHTGADASAWNWGADIVMHSVTKYIGGPQRPARRGLLVVKDKELRDKLYFIQKRNGGP